MPGTQNASFIHKRIIESAFCDHYRHVVGAAERAASEQQSQQIGLQLKPWENYRRTRENLSEWVLKSR